MYRCIILIGMLLLISSCSKHTKISSNESKVLIPITYQEKSFQIKWKSHHLHDILVHALHRVLLLWARKRPHISGCRGSAGWPGLLYSDERCLTLLTVRDIACSAARAYTKTDRRLLYVRCGSGLVRAVLVRAAVRANAFSANEGVTATCALTTMVSSCERINLCDLQHSTLRIL